MLPHFKGDIRLIATSFESCSLQHIFEQVIQFAFKIFTQAYLEPCRTSTMEHLCENSLQKYFIEDVRLKSKYAFAIHRRKLKQVGLFVSNNFSSMVNVVLQHLVYRFRTQSIAKLMKSNITGSQKILSGTKFGSAHL